MQNIFNANIFQSTVFLCTAYQLSHKCYCWILIRWAWNFLRIITFVGENFCKIQSSGSAKSLKFYSVLSLANWNLTTLLSLYIHPYCLISLLCSHRTNQTWQSYGESQKDICCYHKNSRKPSPKYVPSHVSKILASSKVCSSYFHIYFMVFAG